MHYHYPSKLVMNNAISLIMQKIIGNALSLLMHCFKKKFKWHFLRNLGDFLILPFNFYLPKPTYIIIFISISVYLVSR